MKHDFKWIHEDICCQLQDTKGGIIYTVQAKNNNKMCSFKKLHVDAYTTTNLFFFV